MDLHQFLGYYSGLYLIKPDMEPSTLLPTLLLIHILDAIVCRLFAGQNGRSTAFWTITGLFLGTWALLFLFLLPTNKKREPSG